MADIFNYVGNFIDYFFLSLALLFFSVKTNSLIYMLFPPNYFFPAMRR